MFSLCIPTMNRFDNFLSKYIDKYLKIELINEIIISDETGDDVNKINNKYGNNEKLILIKNENRLGPFLNKLKVCSFAKNEWIVLLDSDNFADESYFIIAKNYIENNIINQKNIILSPSKASPNFDYSHLSGFIYKNGDFKINLYKENNLIKKNNSRSTTLMNTGNYILNKYLIDNIDLTKEKDNINNSSSCDVIYFNTLLFEQLDLNLHVVPNLEYHHIVHNGSIYLQTHNKFKDFANKVHNRYNLLK